MRHPRPAVFITREGLLDELTPGKNSAGEVDGSLRAVSSEQRLSLCRRTGPFLRELQTRGLLVLVVSTHPGLASGELTPLQLDRIHRRFVAAVESQGATLAGIYSLDLGVDESGFAPALHDLLVDAAATHGIDPHRSFLVCQQARELEVGRALGLNSIVVASQREVSLREEVDSADQVTDLLDVLEFVDRREPARKTVPR